MAVTSITQGGPDGQGEEGLWEDICYRIGCARARQEAEERLQALEQRLYQQRPGTGGWKDFGNAPY
jgi:hypothetical protein